jgi:hypothetical protein
LEEEELIFKYLNYAKGISPVITTVYLSLRYQGLSGILLGTGFTLQGFFKTFFFKPMKDPIKTKGDEQQTQRSSKAIRSVNLI